MAIHLLYSYPALSFHPSTYNYPISFYTIHFNSFYYIHSNYVAVTAMRVYIVSHWYASKGINLNNPKPYMASLSTTLKPLASFSPFVKQRNPNSNSNALFTYHTPNSTNYMLSKRGGSVAHKKLTFVAVHDAPDQVESFSRIPFSEVVVAREKKPFWKRSWKLGEVFKLSRYVVVHLLSLWAPFHFSWAAFRLFFWLVIIKGICITLSYHRNLSHRSFDLPKWLEYLFAYGGVLAFQVWLFTFITLIWLIDPEDDLFHFFE